MTDSRPASSAGSTWWRRNRVLFTHMLPMLLVAAGIGWLSVLTWMPRQHVYNVYVVCPSTAHQWCGVVHDDGTLSRVKRP